MTESQGQDIQKTPLDALHRKLGAKMVPFAGFDMPLQYTGGIIAEHLHTRSKAALFDVSHMGQAILAGDDPAAALERLVPGDIRQLPVGKILYTMLTNDQGGIIDDLMVTNHITHLHLVVNAACKEKDFAHIRGRLAGSDTLEERTDRALLALQGPDAAQVLARIAPACRHLLFMTAEPLTLAGVPCLVSRAGYTGEDGFEISVPNEEAENLAGMLLDEPEVQPIGLGARDTLRLEAGLCLYGNDIDETTTPIEAALAWSISKRRRAEGGFPGADVIIRQIAEGPGRKRVGLRLEGKAPVRAHSQITDPAGEVIGEVTSGGYGPTLGAPVAMGYVTGAHAQPETPVNLIVRGKPLAGRVAALPFAEHRYVKR